LCALLLSACASTQKNHGSEPEKTTEALNLYYAAALKGDVKAGIEKVRSKKKLSLAEMKLIVQHQDRFIKKIKTQLNVEDDFVAKVIWAYQDYWNEVLTKELTEREGFYLLFKNLNKVLEPQRKNIKVYDDENLKSLADLIKAELRKRGHFSLTGMTRPHLELMVWKKQQDKTYKVKLHDGVQKVKVVLMDQFDSLGWSAYATFDHSFTGGWATREKLFCVKPAYKLKSESFKVSYLKHEARHFADYKLFPDLKQPELEYRAKLTELIYADASLYELLQKFKDRGANTRVSPHAWANHHVHKNIQKKLGLEGGETVSFAQIDKKRIRAAALELLKMSDIQQKANLSFSVGD